MFKNHAILVSCLLLATLFASVAKAETINENPGTVGSGASDLAWPGFVGVQLDILWTDNKTCEWEAGTHFFVLWGELNQIYSGFLLDASGNEIPGLQIIGETPGGTGDPIGFGVISLPETTVFSGMRILMEFSDEYGYGINWDDADRPLVGLDTVPVEPRTWGRVKALYVE